MKLIVAIIRPDRLNEVLEALYRAEVTGLTVSRVLGHGGETDRVETYRGTTVKMELQEKVRLEIGVSDPFVNVTIRAIVNSAHTGEVGDGKVTPPSPLIQGARSPGDAVRCSGETKRRWT